MAVPKFKYEAASRIEFGDFVCSRRLIEMSTPQPENFTLVCGTKKTASVIGDDEENWGQVQTKLEEDLMAQVFYFDCQHRRCHDQQPQP